MRRLLAYLLPLGLFLPACAGVGTPPVIYLARHGQSPWNRVGRVQGDPGLDAVGYVNRAQLWYLLKDEPIAAVYTSGLRRTILTAELVARQHKLPIQPRPVLNEIDTGLLLGMCYAQINPWEMHAGDEKCEVPARGSRPEETLKWLRPLVKDLRGHRLDGKAPLGESYLDMAVRTQKFVDELRAGWQSRPVLVVGHGVVNRILLHQLLGWPLANVSKIRQENDQVYKIEGADTASPTVSLFTPGFGWRRCTPPSQVGQKQLDCNPGPAKAESPRPAPAPATAPAPSAPAPAPAAPGTATP
ncbi:MAG: histidine phosphatase family protein [Deltaproteobacteria bacterium]|nr:histidine phosphatase family protein [Deltaproteobacteria bacterium]